MEISRSWKSHNLRTHFRQIGQRALRIRMGFGDETTGEAAGDSSLNAEMFSQKIRKNRIPNVIDSPSYDTKPRKKNIPKRCPMLTIANRNSTIIIEQAIDDDRVDVIAKKIFDRPSHKSKRKLDVCNFPYYYRDRYEDVVLVKDACVSCTILTSKNSTIRDDKSSKQQANPSLEYKFVKQLKIEYNDLTTITRKISSYTRDILTGIATRTSKKNSINEIIDENCTVTLQPMAMQYFDKSGKPCLKLRLCESGDSASDWNCNVVPIERRLTNLTTRKSGEQIRSEKSPEIHSYTDTNSSICNSLSNYNYLMYPERIISGSKKIATKRT